MKSLRWSLPFLLVCLLGACGGAPAPAPDTPVVMVARATAVQAGQAFAGEVRARQESQLSFQVAGRLVKRHVDAGDRVRAGQVLAELDVADYALQLQAAQAQLAAAEAESKRTAADLARYRTLAEQQLVSRSALAAQQTAMEAAQAQVRSARAQRDVMANQAGYAQLRAPVDGVVANRLVEAGQVLAAGQPVLTLAADGEREVLIALPEQGIAGFAVGQPAEVELWNTPGRRLSGRLREIAAAADPQSRTFAARVVLDQPQGLAIGQSARVFLGSAGEAVAVPLAAVQGEPGRAQATVFVLEGEKPEARLKQVPVQVSRWGRDQAILSGGIARGQWVVAAGGHLLADGMAVRAVDRDNRPLDGATATATAADKSGE